MTLDLVGEAERAGARRAAACAVLGVSARTVERWRRDPAAADQRGGPTTAPANTLTADERQEVLATVNAPRFRDLSPNQIVPLLADEGRYLASEATIYRILRAEALLHHRERSQAPVRRPPMAHTATGPNQVWSWDITYLRSPVRGIFFYLYLVVDVWSRKIMAWDVYEAESAELASGLIEGQCAALGLDPRGLVLHADNGGPMKGATMVATLERLGILASFSRPSVSDDNPYSEALFRTLKYRPEYPDQPFADPRGGARLGGGLCALVQHGAPAQWDPLRHPGGSAQWAGGRHPRGATRRVRERARGPPRALEPQPALLDAHRARLPESRTGGGGGDAFREDGGPRRRTRPQAGAQRAPSPARRSAAQATRSGVPRGRTTEALRREDSCDNPSVANREGVRRPAARPGSGGTRL